MSLSVKNIVKLPQTRLEDTSLCDAISPVKSNLVPIGGVLSNTNYVWQAKGSCLEVSCSKTGRNIGSCVFDGLVNDSNTRIVCVEELQKPNGRLFLLVIGIECSISGGLICIFDVFPSVIIRSIHINQKISTLHVVDPGIENLNLPGPLRNFDGILAVGTDGGDVILLDICKQLCEESLHLQTKKDELNPRQVLLLTAKHVPNIEYYKEKSVQEGKHLGIHLNAVFDNKTDHFVLKGPTGNDCIFVNKEEVVVSAVYYCGQLTSLLVGYNFGAFQLWDLTSLKLIYTSPICEEHIPVTHFALQEPTDDPRAFCYIWVSYSNNESFQAGLPFAVMYALCYDSKEYHEGYGYLYQDFQNCTIRFQMELGQIDAHKDGLLPKGGHCLGIQSITVHSANRECFSSFIAGDVVTLCLISWTFWYTKTDTQTCMLIFDLNQWYKEQMPYFSKWSDCNDYILRVNIRRELTLQSPLILSVAIDEKSLEQYVGVQKLEEHFCPTSFSFNLCVLCETVAVSLRMQSLQKLLLAHIESAGSMCPLRPTEVFRQAVSIGLIPLFVDVKSANVLHQIDLQREIILSIALEHQLFGWLCKCASDWANGSFSAAGCSLDLFLNWAFQRVLILKNNCDQFCVLLFDNSQSKLDANINVLFNSCKIQLKGLLILYNYIEENLGNFVNCLDLIREQRTRLEMLCIYFEVIQWLVNVGLLPESRSTNYHRSENSERISAPYPAQELAEYYNEKRAENQLLSNDYFDCNDSLLFIDNLISRKCGGITLQTQWQKDEGTGFYPPPSLQSLVRTYLIDGADISHKHSLIIYLFLDLAMALDQNKYSSVVTHLIKFPAVFKVSSSLIKITQAFWHLDHGDYATAMDQLLDPFVLGEDLQEWHHAIAMKSLLINKQSTYALRYLRQRKPQISDEKDILMAISVFMANDMLDEAFYFIEQHKSNNEVKLLTHLFKECGRNESLHAILYKSLDTVQEKTFFKYLKCAQIPNSSDLQIFYHLLRSRFVEAFDAHSSQKNPHERLGLIGQSQSTKTDQIVTIFKSLLPDVNKKLVEYVRKERSNLWKEGQNPEPMSVFLHDANEQVRFKSSLIHAALVKAKHTFNESINNESLTEETPFLRSPTATRGNRRTRHSVITPIIIDDDNVEPDAEASPCKRIKLSPRLSTSEFNSPLRSDARQITLTPIIKRKISLEEQSAMEQYTPHSILKATNITQQEPDETIDHHTKTNHHQESNTKIQCRSSYSKQHVQFEDSAGLSSSLSDQSTKQFDQDESETVPLEQVNETNDDSDSVFYSPSDSYQNLNGETENKPEEPTPASVEDVEPVVKSPKARRSYKRSLAESPSIRSSPRLSKLHSEKSDDGRSGEVETIKETSRRSSDSFVNDSPITKRSVTRRSLSRQVLERNTSKLLETLTREEKTIIVNTSVESRKMTCNENEEVESSVAMDESSVVEINQSEFYEKSFHYDDSTKEECSIQKTEDNSSVKTSGEQEFFKEEQIVVEDSVSCTENNENDCIMIESSEVTSLTALTPVANEEIEDNDGNEQFTDIYNDLEENDENVDDMYDSDESSIPELQKAFVADQSEAADAVVTISDDDEEENDESTSESRNSAFSKTTEENTCDFQEENSESCDSFNKAFLGTPSREPQKTNAHPKNEACTNTTPHSLKFTANKNTIEEPDVKLPLKQPPSNEVSTNTTRSLAKPIDSTDAEEALAQLNSEVTLPIGEVIDTEDIEDPNNLQLYLFESLTGEEEDVGDVTRPPASEDTSSNTTEGEPSRKEIVTAEIHASNKDEEKPSVEPTKSNRQSSVIDCKIADYDDITLERKVKSPSPEKVVIVARRSRRAASAATAPTSEFKIDCDADDSMKLIDGVGTNKVSKSKSSAKPTARRRAKSLYDDTSDKSAGKSRAAKSKTVKKVTSDAQEYGTTRRLTRHQASIIRGISTIPEERISLDVDDIDPINLLDKGSFEGKPDPEETMVYDRTSPSTSATSARKTSLRNRSNSVASAASNSLSQSHTERSKRSTRSQTKSPPAGVLTRSRTCSESSSVVSEVVESGVSSKRASKRKRGANTESEVSTRSRTESVSSNKSGASTKRVTRASGKSNLPDIEEEKNSESASTSGTRRKPKKHS